jgi:hypothetical protein
VCLSLAGLAMALAAAGCSGSSSSTGPDAAPSAPVSGSAVVQGTVTGAGAGLEVGVVGTPLFTEVDDEGQFVLSGVPIGTAALKFVGAGIDARVDVPDLRDGLVTSITVQVSGGTARLTATPNCTPTAETAFSGVLEQIAGRHRPLSRRHQGRLQGAGRGLGQGRLCARGEDCGGPSLSDGQAPGRGGNAVAALLRSQPSGVA